MSRHKWRIIPKRDGDHVPRTPRVSQVSRLCDEIPKKGSQESIYVDENC
jgi:hypothetical protein